MPDRLAAAGRLVRRYRDRRHPVARVVALVLTALAAATVSLVLAGSVDRTVGPFDAELSLRPTLRGDTLVQIAPLGTIRLDSHDGPLQLQVRLTQLREAEARRIVNNPAVLDDLGGDVAADIRSGVLALVLRAAAVVAVGALVVGLAVLRRPRRAAIASAVALAAVAASGGAAAATWRAESLAEPQYTGLLARAPAAVGSVEDIVERFQAYQRQLGRLVANLSEIYATTSTLPSFVADDDTIRVLHVTDLHLNPAAFDIIASVVQQFQIDAVVDTGDITDWGSEPEAAYVNGIGRLKVPYVYVRGNHDSLRTQAAVAAQRNAVVLDEEVAEVAGLRILGAGDPRFTPDKSTGDGEDADESLARAGRRLADLAATADPPVDLAAFHDPAGTDALFGVAPVVLSGHRHKRDREVRDGTVLLIEASTGGAGLRGLEGEEPTPIGASVLYFDAATGELRAYDAITLGGLGESDVRISRRVIPVDEEGSQVSRP